MNTLNGKGAALLVVAKAPVPGLAKTRLCPPATSEQAADLAAAALLDTLDAVLATADTVPVVALTGDLSGSAREAEVRAMLEQCIVIPQRGSGLALRLTHAHADTGALLPGLPVLQIGMDTPQVTAAGLGMLTASLRDHDALLGSATDGGWWVLGLKEPRHAKVLTDVPMSRPDTGENTRRALVSAGLRPLTAPTLSDVDTFADAEFVADAAPESRFACSVRRLLSPVEA